MFKREKFERFFRLTFKVSRGEKIKKTLKVNIFHDVVVIVFAVLASNER